MKQILTFFTGMLLGALLYHGILTTLQGEEKETSTSTETVACEEAEAEEDKDMITFFDSPGECIGTYKYEVTSVIEPGYALANELSNEFGIDTSTFRSVLIYDSKKKPFYDGQIVVIPKGYCARHIGTYKYGYEGAQTAPVVQIMKK